MEIRGIDRCPSVPHSLPPSQVRRYLKSLEKNKYNNVIVDWDLGESFSEEEDDFVPNYIAKTLVLGIRGTTKNKKTGVVVPNAKIVEIRTELEDTEASNLDSLEGFNGTPSPPRAPGQRGASGGD